MARRRNKEENKKADETWLIPYADLLTLLLALFIVMFAASQVDQEKFDQISKALSGAFSGGFSFFQSMDVVPVQNQDSFSIGENIWDEQSRSTTNEEKLEQMEKETSDLESLQEQIDQYIADNNLVGSLDTHLNHEQLKITISDVALFASASAVVKPEAEALAKSMAEMLKQYPQYEVKIAGHTDDVPINTVEFPSNWELSAKRALNFMKILLEIDHEVPGRYSAVGYGEYRPIATNETVDGRSQNRRVEVSILRTVTEGVTLDVE